MKIAVLVLYALMMVTVIVFTAKKSISLNDFLLGGRRVGPWMSALSYGTSYFSAVIIVGYAGSVGWKVGLSAVWAGIGNALYMLMTADMVTAEDALRMGLVQKVTDPETLLDETLEIARKIASKGPKAVKKVKAVTRQGFGMSFVDGSELEAKEFGTLFKDEGEEGMKAFLEKRPPKWS